MGMNKEKVYKWIDFSTMPKDKRNTIDWIKSVGCKLPFIYGEVSGIIEIKEYIKDRAYVRIDIGGYTYGDGYTLSCSSLRKCTIGRALERKIVDVAPELIQYLVNKDDAYKYASQSNQEVLTQCPICGFKKHHKVYNLYKCGFGCPVCSDGISYPNKFMFNVLQQTGIPFINEVTKKNDGFEWVQDYRYDFYIEANNNKYFIEMDGGLHKKPEAIARDIVKNKLAKENGVNIIRIDCDYKDMTIRFDYIKANILNSYVNSIIDLSIVDWEKANINSIGTYIPIAAQMWEDEISVSEIANKLSIDKHTVHKYLEVASKCELCTYSKEKSENRRKNTSTNTIKMIYGKPICVFLNGMCVGVFDSVNSVDQKSIELYGCRLHKSNITAALAGRRNHVHGYTFQQITREQYEQYKLQQEIPVY